MNGERVWRTIWSRHAVAYGFIMAIVLIAGLAAFLVWKPAAQVVYPTYFTYTADELDRVRSLDSERRISIDELSLGRTDCSTW